MKGKAMGNEQSGRPSGPYYRLALMTEAILPRTDNYILNQIGQWAAQQTRTPIPRVIETTECIDTTNGNGSDDGIQTIGDNPPLEKPLYRHLGSFGLKTAGYATDVAMPSPKLMEGYDAKAPRTKRATPASSSRDRSRFASYHKPPHIPNVDGKSYLEFFRRDLPNIYRKQAVNFKRKTDRRENGVNTYKSSLTFMPISDLLSLGEKKSQSTQTELTPVAVSTDAIDKSEPIRQSPRKVLGDGLCLQLLKKELDQFEEDRFRETAANQRLVAKLAENRRNVQGQLAQPIILVLSPQTPPLTNEMRNCIDKALRIADHSRLVVEEFKLRITRGDLHKLEGLNWLNDSIINFYFAMLADRSEKDEKLPKVYSFSTFFYERLRTEGYKGVQRWTKRVDVFSKDILLVPVHLGMHWCLAVIDFRLSSIEYYDSMGGDNDECLKSLFMWVQEESRDKKKIELNVDGWRTLNRKDIPQQQNGSDCGMFACRFAEYVTRAAKINFTQKDMAYFRQRTMFEILEKRLL